MTPEEFYKEMKKISKIGDREQAHGLADELMCKVLTQLGYKKGIDIYNSMEQWYA